jgi:hypothetical protein
MRRRHSLALLLTIGITWLAPHATTFAQVSQESSVVYFPLVARNFLPPLRTRINDIVAFLNQCPNTDLTYAQIRSDFIIRRDGVEVGDVPCTGPYPAMPIGQLTNELISLQALRVAYYMDPGVPNHLPWTTQSLYSWMAAHVGGINLKTAPGQLYCCDVFDGELYVVQSIQSDAQREFKRDWPGISSTLNFFVHEVRHANGGPGHVTGCVAFPNPGDPPGCDQSYDLSNLGSYGVQYWLVRSWMTGFLNVGVSCTPATAQTYVTRHLNDLNFQFRNRFVENIPPMESLPLPPYGGPCPAP